MKFLIIDGNSIMNRAFYGVKLPGDDVTMKNNALVGFIRIYLKHLKEEQPKYAAVAFDVHAPTFRHKMYDAYKGTRQSKPEEFLVQMPVIKEILSALGITVIEKAGYEADDIIGTLSRVASEKGISSTIITGDRDSFQLINDKVTVLFKSNKGDVRCTPENIREAYGVEPRALIDVKSLMGDKSDNIPGAPGIGEKTALMLINKYQTTDFIYEFVDTLDIPSSVKDKLVRGKEQVELSKKLAEIDLNVPISEDMDEYLIHKADFNRITEILVRMEMPNTLMRIRHALFNI